MLLRRFCKPPRVLRCLGLLINVVLASVKIVAGVIGHAYVLIADGIESALDIGGSIVIWGGLTVAARPPDETHPYGHGKAEPIAAIAVALGVLAAATGLAIESVREILTPHHGPAPFTLAILIVVIVVKEILFRLRQSPRPTGRKHRSPNGRVASPQ